MIATSGEEVNASSPFSLSTYLSLTVLNAINKFTADPSKMFIALLLLALSTLSAPFVISAMLEGATRKQCLTRDWPADKHTAHMTFCETYGYPTK